MDRYCSHVLIREILILCIEYINVAHMCLLEKHCSYVFIRETLLICIKYIHIAHIYQIR